MIRMFLRTHYLIVVFMSAYLTLGIVTHGSYPVSWDEPINYYKGVLLYQHLFDREVQNPITLNREHGNLDKIAKSKNEKILICTQNSKENLCEEFQASMPTVQQLLLRKQGDQHDFLYAYNASYPLLLYLINPNRTIERYHLLNILFASTIFLCIYKVLFRTYHNQYRAIIAPLFLFFSPQFVGHIPMNPKDIPFAWIYFLGLTAIFCFSCIHRPVRQLIILGLIFGFSQNLRILGLTLYPLLLTFDLINHISNFRKHQGSSKYWAIFVKQELESFIVIGAVAASVSLLTWPFLGSNVISHAQQLFIINKDFPWHGTTLFNGKFSLAQNFQWQYIPTMIAVTTPVVILIACSIAPLLLFQRNKSHNRLLLLMIMTLTINALIFGITKPTFYDGIRHFLFIYPPIIVLATITTIELLHYITRRKIQIIVILCFVIYGTLLLRQIIVLHPYQYTYYNSLTGGLFGAYRNYELDYWNLSHQEAAHWIDTIHNSTYDNHDTQAQLSSTTVNTDFEIRLNRYTNTVPKDTIHTISRNQTPFSFIIHRKDQR